MSPLDQLHALDGERQTIQKHLQPLQVLIAQKQSELSKVRATVADAQVAMDEAVKHSATVAAKQALGTASIDDAKAAHFAREAAQKAFVDAQGAAVGIRDLITEYDAMQAAGHEFAMRLGAIAAEENALHEKYLRQLADEAADEYATAARRLSEKLATVLGFQQALAAANFEPDLLTPGVWNFGIPSLNTVSAKTAGGCLVEIEHVRNAQPKAYAAICASVAADGIRLEEM